MSRFLNERFAALEVYTPGEQPKDRTYIKLNTNESPFPPSEKTMAAVNADALRDLRLYSDPTCSALRTALAKRYGVEAENVYVANGSDDILNFAFLAFGQKGAAFPEISYGFYKVFAALHGVGYAAVPLEEDFSIDAGKYRYNGRLIVIANPNAPTGLCLSLDEIEEILQNNPDSVVLIDEAYIDFGGTSCLPLLQTYRNLLVTGTFSKSRSMAGARLGFCFADPELIADLRRIKYSTNPYNVNRLTLAAGTAALEDDAYYADNCKRIMENRAYTAAALTALGFRVLPSKANFIFAESPAMDGEMLYRKLKENGILVRHFTTERIRNFNRITIGSRKEMQTFVKTVTRIMEEAK